LEELYVADLDAILSGRGSPDLIGEIVSKSGMRVMVDAGFQRADEVGEYLEKGVEKIVLATETLRGWGEVSKVKARGASVVASLDVKLGQVVAESKEMVLPLRELVERFETEGASEIILLSLDRVGTARGPDYGALKVALDCASVPVLAAGGVRNMGDLRCLEEIGISGVLIATALHRGIITKADLSQLLHER
jgi:phosphoribosylformimino-5-aminoimidazole carboxamide ribotide isomerase